MGMSQVDFMHAMRSRVSMFRWLVSMPPARKASGMMLFYRRRVLLVMEWLVRHLVMGRRCLMFPIPCVLWSGGRSLLSKLVWRRGIACHVQISLHPWAVAHGWRCRH